MDSMAQTWDVLVSVVRAFRPGDIIVVQFKQPLSMSQREIIRGMLKAEEERLGVKFMLLDGGAEVAGREETAREKANDGRMEEATALVAEEDDDTYSKRGN